MKIELRLNHEPKWEYCETKLVNENMAPLLNRYGEKGWELVAVTQHNLTVTAYMKREVKEGK